MNKIAFIEVFFLKCLNKLQCCEELVLACWSYSQCPIDSPGFCCIFVKATDFVLQIFAAAVAAWCDHTTPLMLGVTANWQPWIERKHFTDKMQSPIGASSLDSLAVHQCLQILPQSILLLLAKEPWKDQTQKVS